MYLNWLFIKKRDGINPRKTSLSKAHLFRFLFLYEANLKEKASKISRQAF